MCLHLCVLQEGESPADCWDRASSYLQSLRQSFAHETAEARPHDVGVSVNRWAPFLVVPLVWETTM